MIRLGSVALFLICGCWNFDRSIIRQTCDDCPLQSVSASSKHTCVTHQDGRLWCFGDNMTSAIGVDGAGEEVSTPTLVPGGPWDQVSAGGQFRTHTCATTKEGELYCWGANAEQESGRTGEADVTTPAQVGSDTDWTHVQAARGASCGLRDGGRLHCWGWQADGRLAVFLPSSTNTASPVPSPVDRTFVDLTMGELHGCAITTEGELYCWGRNDAGQRGHMGMEAPPEQVEPGMRFAAVEAGVSHTCAISLDGTLVCWGDNSSGQLGRAMPTQSDAPLRVEVDGDDRFSVVSAAERHTCAIRNDGALFCWGAASSALGLGTGLNPVVSPTRVGDRADWTSVAAGYNHTCAAAATGELLCWGSAGRGQTGLATDAAVPQSVTLD